MENNHMNTAYDGRCAFAVSTGKTDVMGGKYSLTRDNRTYLFSNGVAKFLFRILPNRVQKADGVWAKKLGSL